MIGGTFQSITQFLPFVHAVNAARAVLSGAYSDVFVQLSIVLVIQSLFL
jgi:ABC-2 type transport system permease protein